MSQLEDIPIGQNRQFEHKKKNNCNGPKHTKDDKIDNFTIIPKTANLSLLEDARVPTHYSENW